MCYGGMAFRPIARTGTLRVTVLGPDSCYKIYEEHEEEEVEVEVEEDEKKRRQ
jgi:hypothetical protein